MTLTASQLFEREQADGWAETAATIDPVSYTHLTLPTN